MTPAIQTIDHAMDEGSGQENPSTQTTPRVIHVLSATTFIDALYEGGARRVYEDMMEGDEYVTSPGDKALIQRALERLRKDDSTAKPYGPEILGKVKLAKPTERDIAHSIETVVSIGINEIRADVVEGLTGNKQKAHQYERLIRRLVNDYCRDEEDKRLHKGSNGRNETLVEYAERKLVADEDRLTRFGSAASFAKDGAIVILEGSFRFMDSFLGWLSQDDQEARQRVFCEEAWGEAQVAYA